MPRSVDDVDSATAPVNRRFGLDRDAFSAQVIESMAALDRLVDTIDPPSRNNLSTSVVLP
jgi:hypothetical protein